MVRGYCEEFHNPRAHHALEVIVASASDEPTRGMTNALLAAFPNSGTTTEAQVASGDTHATVGTAPGTHRGEWAALICRSPARGRSVRWTATTTL